MTNIPASKMLSILGGFALGFGTGIVVDHLINKSKADKLQKQVATLQMDNSKLIHLLEDCDNEIDRLISKCKFTTSSSVLSKLNDDFHIILKYALGDYAKIFLNLSSGEDIFENDLVFFRTMDNFLEGRTVTDEGILAILERANLRYKSQIAGNVEPNYGSLIQRLKG